MSASARLAVDGHYRLGHRSKPPTVRSEPIGPYGLAPGRVVVSTVAVAPFSFTTIQVWTAKMLRHFTVRAAKIRIMASEREDAGGNRPALDLSAVCQFPRPSPRQR